MRKIRGRRGILEVDTADTVFSQTHCVYMYLYLCCLFSFSAMLTTSDVS